MIDFLSKVTKIISESILELNLDPKFGMVTAKSQGSHSDMNYELMKRSIGIITPYLALMAISGFCNPLKIFLLLSKILG